MSPSGSFKDRGAFVLTIALKELVIKEVVEDSSGNAGAAIAAYCAAARIRCSIYLPDSTSAGKIKQISTYKANIVKVPGTRDEPAKAILKRPKKRIMRHMFTIRFFFGCSRNASLFQRRI